MHQAPGFVGAVGSAQDEDYLAVLAVGQIELGLHGGARVETRAGLAREMRAVERGRVGERAVAPQELGAAAGEAASGLAHLGEQYPAGRPARVCVASEERSGIWILLCDYVHEVGVTPLAQHQLPVGRERQAPGAAGAVGQLDHHELHRRVHGDVGGELRRDPRFLVLEDAVAEPVPADVAGLAGSRQGSGRPEGAGLLIAQIERFTAGVAHRVVVEAGAVGTRERSPPTCTRRPSR